MCKYIINTNTVITERRERVVPKQYTEERNKYWESYSKTFRIVGKRMENFDTYTLDAMDVLEDCITVSHIYLSKIQFSDVIFTRFCSAKNIIATFGNSCLIHPCFVDVVIHNPESGEYFIGEEKAHSLLESEPQYALLSSPIIYQNNLGISSLKEASKVVLTTELDIDLKFSLDTLINHKGDFHFISKVTTELTSTDLNKKNKHTKFACFKGWKTEDGNNGKATSEAVEILKLSL